MGGGRKAAGHRPLSSHGSTFNLRGGAAKARILPKKGPQSFRPLLLPFHYILVHPLQQAPSWADRRGRIEFHRSVQRKAVLLELPFDPHFRDTCNPRKMPGKAVKSGRVLYS